MAGRPADYTDSDSDEEDEYYNYRPSTSRPPTNGGPKTVGEAIGRRDIDVLSKLVDIALNKGVSLDTPTESKLVPLMEACSCGFVEAVELLLKKGANPNSQKELMTPLMWCCVGYAQFVRIENRTACVKLLLQHNADPNMRNSNARTALMLAAKSGFLPVVKELLTSEKVDVNCTDSNGWTALFFAYEGGHSDMVSALIEAGCDEAIKSYHGLLAAELANFIEDPNDLKIGDLFIESRVPDTYALDEEDLVESRIEKFLDDLPDDKGEGGFIQDVQSFLLGCGLASLNLPEADFPTILRGSEDELKKVGVKFSAIRQKIILAAHKYHMQPWKSSSLPHLPKDGPLWMEDANNLLASVTKHLTIINATVNYVKQRIEADSSYDEELITIHLGKLLLVQHNVQSKLKFILREIEKIVDIGERPAGFIGKKKESYINSQNIIAATTFAFLSYMCYRYCAYA